MSSIDLSSAPVATAERLNAPQLKDLFRGALYFFEQHYQEVNALNVFPVPDGDTGTNMLLTLRSAYDRCAQLDASRTHVGELLGVLAKGALYGSAGNSGTFLSEILNGMAATAAPLPELTIPDFVAGLRAGVNAAYKATDVPVEGTILTVARETAEAAEDAVSMTATFFDLFSVLVRAGMESVNRTPELLPVLKKAGVVDSGGRGFVFILEGMQRTLAGEVFVPVEGNKSKASAEANTEISTQVMRQKRDTALPPALRMDTSHNARTDLRAGSRTDLRADDPRGYPYDVQFVVTLRQPLELDTIKDTISAMGDSMVVTRNGDTVKVHIHVYDPGQPLSYGAQLGRLEHVIVEDMQGQFEDFADAGESARAGDETLEAKDNKDSDDKDSDDLVTSITSVPPGQIGVIGVALGAGFAEALRAVGCSAVVTGGPTMNPSVGDFVTMAEQLGAERLILFPNDRNVIRTANKAAELLIATGTPTTIVPTSSIPQAISALISAFYPEGDLDSTTQALIDASHHVATAEITRASRSIDGLNSVDVRKGQWIGLVDGNLIAAGDQRTALIIQCLDQMIVNAPELITVYYGEAVTPGEARTLVHELEERYSGLAFETVSGGQPNYDFIISAE